MYLEERQFVSGERDVLRVASLICIAMGKILCGGEGSEGAKRPFWCFGKFEATSGPVAWAKVTQVPLASASHL